MLGSNIKRIFQMATEWNAVILLDEADVFMAERHPHDIARNELVSIFLRELEYYRGIIFLTTNLYQTIDSAFRSRVSLHLLFKPLGVEAREAIWRKFLDRLPVSSNPGIRVELGDEGSVDTVVTAKEAVSGALPTESTASIQGDDATVSNCSVSGESHGVIHVPEAPTRPVTDISDEDIKELAAWHLNGREIKNAVKMVKSWCDCKGYDLTLARLENGIRVTSPHASKMTHENDTSLYDD